MGGEVVSGAEIRWDGVGEDLEQDFVREGEERGHSGEVSTLSRKGFVLAMSWFRF